MTHQGGTWVCLPWSGQFGLNHGKYPNGQVRRVTGVNDTGLKNPTEFVKYLGCLDFSLR